MDMHSMHNIGTDHAGSMCSLTDVMEALPTGSLALDQYLVSVYGCGKLTRVRTRSWDWTKIEFIWMDKLPKPLIQRCKWETKAHGKGSVFHLHENPLIPWAISGALWVNGLRSAGEPINWGGSRAAPRSVDYGWVEVMHRTFVVAKSTFVNTLEHDGLWLYRARGSGVWYRTGRTFSVSDLADLGIWLAATGSELGKHTEHYTLRKPAIFAAAARLLRAQGYDTIEFRSHVDLMEQTAYKRELVGLRNYPRPSSDRSETCPPDPDMRGGWDGSLEKCTCDPHTAAQGGVVKCSPHRSANCTEVIM